jgi:hypothetical protein
MRDKAFVSTQMAPDRGQFNRGSEQFAPLRQHLVNHASQRAVNHARQRAQRYS